MCIRDRSVASVSTQVTASPLLNAPIVLTFAFVKRGFATKCATGGDGGGELAGVWGRGLLAVESVVWALRAGESAVAVALVRASDRTEKMSYR